MEAVAEWGFHCQPSLFASVRGKAKAHGLPVMLAHDGGEVKLARVTKLDIYGLALFFRPLVASLLTDDANAGLAHYWRWVVPPKSYNKRTFYQVKPNSEVLFRQAVFREDIWDIDDPSAFWFVEDYTCGARGARGQAWRGMRQGRAAGEHV